MKWFRNCPSLRTILMLLPLFVFVPGRTSGPAAKSPSYSAHSAAFRPQRVSPDGQILLRALAEGGELPELRWPNFRDYTKHITKFYEAYDYALPWVRDMRPIPVLIVYGTVIVLEDGLVHFYDDIYGHDATLEAALEKGYPYPP
jgi:hypothetical protein